MKLHALPLVFLAGFALAACTEDKPASPADASLTADVAKETAAPSTDVAATPKPDVAVTPPRIDAAADTTTSVPDAVVAEDAADGGDAAADAAAADAGDAADGGGDGGAMATVRPVPTTDLQKRGDYLVNSVLGCERCHNRTGMPYLAGIRCFSDNMPTVDGKGCLNSPNLTNHATGLQMRTAVQIKNLFRGGVRPDGKFLFSTMPAHLYANLTDEDADAIVAYLRIVPGVNNQLPANESPFTDAERPTARPLSPVGLFEENAIPLVPDGAPNEANRDKGRYLAALVCVECHTKPLTTMPATKSFDPALSFQGGKEFTATIAGVSTKVYSVNLTPDATGIKGWTPADFIKLLKMGVDRDGKKACSPMRSFPGMTDADVTNIANYFLGIDAKVNALPMQCSTM